MRDRVLKDSRWGCEEQRVSLQDRGKLREGQG